MDDHLQSILLVVSLFLLGVLTPGPNFLVVVEQSLSSGRRSGILTGLGVATGDAVYAAAGLLGLSSILEQAQWLIAIVKLLGGAYIVFLGVSLLLGSSNCTDDAQRGLRAHESVGRSYRRGLLTDLANPKTILFFTSIFALAYQPGQPAWVVAAMWVGIVLSSVGWRFALATLFSKTAVRNVYARFCRQLECIFGTALTAFGIHLILARQRV